MYPRCGVEHHIGKLAGAVISILIVTAQGNCLRNRMTAESLAVLLIPYLNDGSNFQPQVVQQFLSFFLGKASVSNILVIVGLEHTVQTTQGNAGAVRLNLRQQLNEKHRLHCLIEAFRFFIRYLAADLCDSQQFFPALSLRFFRLLRCQCCIAVGKLLDRLAGHDHCLIKGNLVNARLIGKIALLQLLSRLCFQPGEAVFQHIIDAQKPMPAALAQGVATGKYHGIHVFLGQLRQNRQRLFIDISALPVAYQFSCNGFVFFCNPEFRAIAQFKLIQFINKPCINNGIQRGCTKAAALITYNQVIFPYKNCHTAKCFTEGNCRLGNGLQLLMLAEHLCPNDSPLCAHLRQGVNEFLSKPPVAL